MPDKDPIYWPDIDVRDLTTDQWLALKRRVMSETSLERARVADVILRHLFANMRRAPVSLSPTEADAAPVGAKLH